LKVRNVAPVAMSQSQISFDPPMTEMANRFPSLETAIGAPPPL
jgi:hypothetical protein